MKKQMRYSSEVRERAVRLLREQQGEYMSEWAARKSIAYKIGCSAETCVNGYDKLWRPVLLDQITDARMNMKVIEVT
ncbi:MAG: hypothetical protein IT525_07960 [Nitrosomonas sp.]|jgi:transposase|nr:hypothetical protein [Nitrosomonas sp.]